MIPTVLSARYPSDERAARRISGAGIGIAGAVGACGGALVNLAFRQSFRATGSADAAYLAFLGCCALCAVVTWAGYLRRPPRRG